MGNHGWLHQRMPKRPKSETRTKTLNELNNDVLQHIFTFLQFDELCSVRILSKVLRYVFKATISLRKTISITAPIAVALYPIIPTKNISTYDCLSPSNAGLIAKYCKSITKLKISDNRYYDVPWISKILENNHCISSLSIDRYNPVTVFDSIYLVCLPLVKLDINYKSCIPHEAVQGINLSMILRRSGNHLEKLTLRGIHNLSDLSGITTYCPRLEELSIWDSKPTLPLAAYLASLATTRMSSRSAPVLTKLTLPGQPGILTQLRKMTGIQRLTLTSWCSFNGLNFIRFSGFFSSLTELQLPRFKKSKYLRTAIASCKHLRKLGFPSLSDRHLFQFLTTCTKLRQVYCTGTCLQKVLTRLIARSIVLTNLVRLQLHGRMIPSGYEELSVVASNLHVLMFSGSNAGINIGVDCLRMWHKNGLDLRVLDIGVSPNALGCLRLLQDECVFPSLTAFRILRYRSASGQKEGEGLLRSLHVHRPDCRVFDKSNIPDRHVYHV